MTITYRTAGAWGAGVGRNLHPAEVDENFFDIDGRLVDVEASIPSGGVPQIVDFRVVGDMFFVDFSDHSTLGPFLLPARSWRFLGSWQPSTAYAVDDIVTANGGVYLVLFAHTSDTVFDPGANDGNGHDFYGLLLTDPANSMPTGGTTGQALVKFSNTDYDVTWASSVLPVGGASGQYLVKNSSADYDAAWVTPGQGNRGTTVAVLSTNFYVLKSTTLSNPSGDEFKYFRVSNGTEGWNVVIPNNATWPFAVGTEISFRQLGTGTVTITASTGPPAVALNYPSGFTNVLYGQHATATIKKVDTDVWDMFGLLTPI